MCDVVPATFEVLDERFARTGGDEVLQRLHTGCRWTEGPVYVPAGRYLLFNDIPNDRTLRWDETTGAVGVLRSPADYANGHTLDRAGRVIACQQGTRRVVRFEHDGSVTVIADTFRGGRFNSPNDVVERSDGSVWFTDPSYGISSDYEGFRAEPEQDGCHVYRVDPSTGAVTKVADDFERPNGLAFSADERRLFVVDTPRDHIRVFDVADDGKLSGGDVFGSVAGGHYDGIRFDDTGRLWAASPDGLHCYQPDGTLAGKLRVPEVVSNLAFGGPKRNDLFITATRSLYSIRVNFTGARYP